MGLAKAIKRGASALLIGSMMTGLFTGCSATGENSGGKLVKLRSVYQIRHQPHRHWQMCSNRWWKRRPMDVMISRL